jgi:hypothetical protein
LLSWAEAGLIVAAAAVPVADQAQNTLENGQGYDNVHPFADEAERRIAQITAVTAAVTAA